MKVLPRRLGTKADLIFKYVAMGSAMALMALVLGFFAQLFVQSYGAFERYGLSFIYKFDWEPRLEHFGAAGAIIGTFSTTIIALLIAVPIAFYVAFLLVEILPEYLSKPIGYGVDLLAAIPSIIYGMWGFVVLLPLMQTFVQPILQSEIPINLGVKPAIIQKENGEKTIHFSGRNGWMACEHNDYLNLQNDYLIALQIEVLEKKEQFLFTKGETGYVLKLTAENAICFNGAKTKNDVLKTGQKQSIVVGEHEGELHCFVEGQKVALSSITPSIEVNQAPLIMGENFNGNIYYLQLYTSYKEKIIHNPSLSTQMFDVENAIDQVGLTAYFLPIGDDERITDLASGVDGYFLNKKIDLNFLNRTLFSSESAPMGSGPLTAGIILALMILPYICAVMRDVLQMTPSVLKESAFGLGSTHWETTTKVTLRYGMQGFLGAVFLGLGRAFGETMAVLFVIGNVVSGNCSLIAPSSTIASTLANSFPEASGIFRNVLFALGFILLLLTFGIQVIAQWWLNKVRKTQGAGL